MMWFCVLIGILAATHADAKTEVPSVTEIEVVAGRDSPKMNCNSSDFDSIISWKIGYQELKQGVLEENWEDLPVRFEKTEDDSVLQIKQVKYEDRANIRCQFKRKPVAKKANETSANGTDTKDGYNYYRVRVRDPLGAVWPTVGILVEAVALFVLITIFEYIARKKDDKLKAENGGSK